jgi:hypothetical protein
VNREERNYFEKKYLSNEGGLRSSQIETPSGPLAFDPYNQRIVNEYIVKVEKRDGKLVNVVIGNMGRWLRKMSGSGGGSKFRKND